jgi:site-specific DNA-methyltransferase (adenine-specific)
MDVSKALDKKAGAERKKVPNPLASKQTGQVAGKGLSGAKSAVDYISPDAVTDEAKEWEGWGTALKPANEPICVARKPIDGTVAENILKYGTGGINIDGSRISLNGEVQPVGSAKRVFASNEFTDEKIYGDNTTTSELGRFPSNVIMDSEAGAMLDEQAPKTGAFAPVKKGHPGDSKNVYGDFAYKGDDGASFYSDNGGASRFFYCPKPDQTERDKGLTRNFELKEAGVKNDSGRGYSETDPYKKVMRRNTHPTVKPVDLMRYLVKLVTPKRGIVLDPFCGSGTTLIGAKMELINFVGIDMEMENVEFSNARVAAWNPEKYLPQELF